MASVNAKETTRLPKMILVIGGTFLMGSNTESEDEKPAHTITLDNFSIAQTETTVEQWKYFCNATNRDMPIGPEWDLNWKKILAPMVNISWEDAVAYCKWLSEKTGDTYRLPTETEWEYAAGGGENASNSIDNTTDNANKFTGGKELGKVGWYMQNSGGNPHAVRLKEPNRLGIYDMTGNAAEWCHDWYDIYGASAVGLDPQGPLSGSGDMRVIRGGGWNDSEYDCRVTKRGFAYPKQKLLHVGFRVVRKQTK